MLKKGDVAPHFQGKDQHGNEVSLAQFRGKKLVIYFYPKDDTPGCTKEACNLRDNYNELLSKGFAVVGVSPDNEESHKKFASKYNLPFPLIADPELGIIKAYGAWGKKSMYGKEYEGLLRTTFVVDENGVVEQVIQKVKTDDHANQIFKLYQ